MTSDIADRPAIHEPPSPHGRLGDEHLDRLDEPFTCRLRPSEVGQVELVGATPALAPEPPTPSPTT
ncbi:hypothetical protein AB0I53_01160 [Saccharopolyspora sp. NPDC050389]|uniref:hypothetical protein n=1 Tax=Saccharopolyspora sp. NPDC050389 TaxID=3155516 RepID=UPI0033E43A6E